MRTVTQCYTAAGVPQEPNGSGVFTLANNTTYYFELSEVADRSGLSVHLIYGSTLTAAVTSEGSNEDGSVTSYNDGAAGEWASTAQAVRNLAASAGGAMDHHADWMAARMRYKVVVGATGGGTLKLREHGKVRSYP